MNGRVCMNEVSRACIFVCMNLEEYISVHELGRVHVNEISRMCVFVCMN